MASQEDCKVNGVQAGCMYKRIRVAAKYEKEKLFSIFIDEVFLQLPLAGGEPKDLHLHTKTVGRV